MPTLLVLGLVGALAQLAAGSLGMGYGVISTSALLALGMTPALASASVHLAEIGTSASLGLSHWRLGNVDRRLVVRLGLPGAVGALAGAVGLTSLPPEAARVAMAAVLVPLGGYLVLRSVARPPGAASSAGPATRRFLVPLGLVGGTVDAVGGGGWGPVATTTLLVSGRYPPRVVVGSVDTAKLLVTVAASVGFIAGLGLHEVPLEVVLVLLASGALVAPVAAWLVSRLPQAVLGVAAGGVVALVNSGPLLGLARLDAPTTMVTVTVLALLWAGALGHVAHRARRASRGVADRGREVQPVA